MINSVEVIKHVQNEKQIEKYKLVRNKVHFKADNEHNILVQWINIQWINVLQFK